jgi:hypothetical protein
MDNPKTHEKTKNPQKTNLQTTPKRKPTMNQLTPAKIFKLQHAINWENFKLKWFENRTQQCEFNIKANKQRAIAVLLWNYIFLYNTTSPEQLILINLGKTLENALDEEWI